MLDGIDAIDWATLRHAYGSAEDVPDLLRALASGDEHKRTSALDDLFGNIRHQGTVYPATAAAVPFLYQLLRSPDVPGKSDIAGLLARIAAGSGYLEVHCASEVGQKTWRKILSEKGKSLEEEIAREAAETSAVRQAAASRLLDLLPYLRDPHPENRGSVAEALGCYPQYKALTLPELRRVAESETHEEVHEVVSESIEKLEKAATNELVGHFG